MVPCTFSAGKVAHVMHSECGLLGELIIDKLPIITTTISTFITAVIIGKSGSTLPSLCSTELFRIRAVRHSMSLHF